MATEPTGAPHDEDENPNEICILYVTINNLDETYRTEGHKLLLSLSEEVRGQLLFSVAAMLTKPAGFGALFSDEDEDEDE